MHTLYDVADREAILRRLSALQSASPRQWGKMNVAQMLAHCAIALEVPCGERAKKQVLIGKILAPFVKKSVLGEKPFGKGAPTDPDFKITDDREFNAERARLVALVVKFCDRGPSATGGLVHSFFGPLTSDEWGRLTYKHLDHHLRQFSA
jgi:hypothetical protein